MHPDQLPPALQTVIARVVKAERRRARKQTENARREVFASLGEVLVKSLPSLFSKAAQNAPVQDQDDNEVSPDDETPAGDEEDELPPEDLPEVDEIEEDEDGEPLWPSGRVLKAFLKAAVHAPAGGVTIDGKKYNGGEFIPGDVVASATAEEKAAIGVEDDAKKGPADEPEKGDERPAARSTAGYDRFRDNADHPPYEGTGEPWDVPTWVPAGKTPSGKLRWMHADSGRVRTGDRPKEASARQKQDVYAERVRRMDQPPQAAVAWWGSDESKAKAASAAEVAFGDKGARGLISLLRPPYGTVISAHGGWADNTLSVSLSHPDVDQWSRSLAVNRDGTVSVSNNLFFLKPGARGSGMGTKAFAGQVQGMVYGGGRNIHTTAGKGGRGGEKMNGYYTWARLGYDTELDESYRKRLPAGLKDARTVQDLMDTKEGAEHWKKTGYMTNMDFDTTPGSRSIRALNRYLESKGEEPIDDGPQAVRVRERQIAERKERLANPQPEPQDRLTREAKSLGLSLQLADLKEGVRRGVAADVWAWNDLLASVQDELGLERVTKADRSHLVRKVIRNRLGRRQVVWVKPQESDKADRGVPVGEDGKPTGEKPVPVAKTREQLAESRSVLAAAVNDPDRLNPEQVRQLADHIDSITKDEAKGLLKQLGAKISGDQMAVAGRLLEAIRAGRGAGGVGEALKRAGNKTSGQYGAWGQAAGGGEKPVSRDTLPKRGVSAEEAAVERARLAKEAEQGGKSRDFSGNKKTKNRKAATGASLAEVVKSYGGIDPNSHALKAHFGNMKEAMEYGLSLGMFKKGGRGFDQMAQELESSGHIQVPEGTEPTQYLADQLMKKASSDLYDRKDELEKAEQDYYAAMQAAADEQGITYEYNPDATAEDIFGDVPGFAEAHRGAENDAAEEAASDPFGVSGQGNERSEEGVDDPFADFDNSIDDPAPSTSAEFDRRMESIDPRDSGRVEVPKPVRPLEADDADRERYDAARERLDRMQAWQADKPNDLRAEEQVRRAEGRLREVVGEEGEMRREPVARAVSAQQPAQQPARRRQNYQTLRKQAAEGMAAGAAAMQQPHDGSGLPDIPLYASLSDDQRADLDAQRRAAKTRQEARGVELLASQMATEAESARRSDAAKAAAGGDRPTGKGGAVSPVKTLSPKDAEDAQFDAPKPDEAETGKAWVGTVMRGRKPAQPGQQTDAGDYGKGLYWSGDGDRAAAYARPIIGTRGQEGQVHVEQVRLENPLVFRTAKEAAQFRSQFADPNKHRNPQDQEAAIKVHLGLMEGGHDGVVVYDTEGTMTSRPDKPFEVVKLGDIDPKLLAKYPDLKRRYQKLKAATKK